MANAMAEYPSPIDLSYYERWHDRLTTLLTYARQRMEASCSRSTPPEVSERPRGRPATGATTSTRRPATYAEEAGPGHLSMGSLTTRLGREPPTVTSGQAGERARTRSEPRNRCRPETDASSIGTKEETYDYGGGCLAYTWALHQVAWPTKFRPCTTLKYGGTSNPREFLQLYSTAKTAARADAKVMAN